jgi:hypothetical protein
MNLPPRLVLLVVLLALSACGSVEQRYDLDGDGDEDRFDCAPSDPSIHPSADDIYGDDVDADCDGGDGVDVDGDGYPINVESDGEYGALLDCDDLNPTVHPGAPDTVGDQRDSNCDGHDGQDADGDDHASVGSGGADCDDDDPTTHPLALDPYGDGLDTDCGGVDGFDGDGDGHPAFDADYAGDFAHWDCNDATPAIHPGVEDLLGDGLDADCDGIDGEDADDDGAASEASGGPDCDDADPSIGPDAADPYGDGLDANCDDLDGVDVDGDGYPGNVSGDPEHGALQDCDDANQAVHPGAVELSDDGLDNDCDGIQAHDGDGDGFAGEADDCDDADPTVFPGAAEAVDCADNDCDGYIDEDTDAADGDGDGFCVGADLGFGLQCCDGALPGDCNDLDPALDAADLDGDGVDSCGGDCDDLDGGRSPLAAELCDGVDNDCDLVVPIDELDGDGDGAAACAGDCDDLSAALNVSDLDGDGASSCAGDCNDGDVALNPLDLDGDGYSTCNNPLDCDDADPLQNQDDLDGDGWSTCDFDCNEDEATAWPGAPELPDAVDNDCDGITDEGTSAFDDDGDGSCEGFDLDGNGLLECSDGTVPGDCDDTDPALSPLDLDWDHWSSCAGDCDDTDPQIHPAAAERNNGLDDDCDTLTDERIIRDFDGDGFSALDGDCDDADPAVWPGAPELCDGSDSDCDGVRPADEEDLDRDTWLVCEGDCDDADGLVRPEGVELCDGLDGDCDGLIDEGCLTCGDVVPAINGLIQDVVDASVPGSVVCVSPGTYVQTVDFGGRALHLLGLGGSVGTVLDAAGVGTVVTFASGETGTSIIEGFTVTGGVAPAGGGIRIVGASPSLLGLDVTGNEAGFDGGGGISMTGSSSLLMDVVVRDNEARDGGGIVASGGAPVLENVLISGNYSNNFGAGLQTEGGSNLSATDLVVQDNLGVGVYLCGGSPDLFNAVIEGNQDSGLSVACGGSAVVQDSQIVDNVAEEGGGIFCRGSSLQLNNVLVAGNTATLSGGGLWTNHGLFTTGCTVSAVASQFVDNEAGGVGGIFAFDADVWLSHVAIVGNRSDWATGGLHVGANAGGDGATLTVDHTVITDNVSWNNSCGGATVNSGVPTGFSYSNVWGNGRNWRTLPDPTGTNGNISVDPQYLDSTPAEIRDWDLHLAVGSPLIDAGNPASSDPDGGLPDIGAYGGTSGGSWDLDGDGAPLWWQPGSYDSATYPALGLDCDDDDPEVGPGGGC